MVRSVWLPEALAAWRLCELFFFSCKGAEPACRQTGHKEIIPNSLHLTYFGACPAELRVRRGGFFSRRGAKEWWSARYDFRRPLRPACGRQAWRAFLVRRGGFSSCKDAETCPPRWAKRNYGPLGLTSAGREPARKCKSCSKTPCCKTCHSLYFFGIAFSGLIFMFR